MPVVSYLRTVPLVDGSTGPATGRFRFKPVTRRVIAGSPDNVVVPATFPAPLVLGVVTVTLAPGAWRVTEAVDGVPDETYTVVVPDDPGPLEGDDLVKVDPSTLEPGPVPAGAFTLLADTDGRPYFA
jgi:hypothetical protein